MVCFKLFLWLWQAQPYFCYCLTFASWCENSLLEQKQLLFGSLTVFCFGYCCFVLLCLVWFGFVLFRCFSKKLSIFCGCWSCFCANAFFVLSVRCYFFVVFDLTCALFVVICWCVGFVQLCLLSLLFVVLSLCSSFVIVVVILALCSLLPLFCCPWE